MWPIGDVETIIALSDHHEFLKFIAKHHHNNKSLHLPLHVAPLIFNRHALLNTALLYTSSNVTFLEDGLLCFMHVFKAFSFIVVFCQHHDMQVLPLCESVSVLIVMNYKSALSWLDTKYVVQL